MSHSPASPSPERERAEALLRVRGDTSVARIDPAPSAEQIGAEWAFGFAWSDVDVVARVYVFDGYREADEALAMLVSAVGDAGNGATNGAYLLWTTVGRDDDESGTDFAAELRSAFAGRE